MWACEYMHLREMITVLFDGVLFSICRRYDEMSDKVSEMPEDTEALVNLQKYLRTVRFLHVV